MFLNYIVKSNLYYKLLNKTNDFFEIPYIFYELHFKAIQKELHEVFELSDLDRKNVSNTKYNFRVWIMWWQGYDQAPKIVKNNFRKLKALFGKKVIFLSKKNVKEYTNINSNLWQKLNNGTIDFTHWSDIVRFNVLRNNGGLWVDSTVLVSPKAKEYILSKVKESFFSISCEDRRYISGGKWIIGFIGGRPNEPLFEYLNNFYENYYEKYTKIIDYLLTDNAIFYYYNKHSEFQKKVNKYRGKWYPYFFNSSYLDKNILKYKKLFNNCQSYSIQIFRYRKCKNYNGTLYDWMINGK